MCLAVPGRILGINEDGLAAVDFSGVEREVSLALVPDARVGEYVLVHAGFAIEVVSEADARETLSLIEELASAIDGIASDPSGGGPDPVSASARAGAIAGGAAS